MRFNTATWWQCIIKEYCNTDFLSQYYGKLAVYLSDHIYLFKCFCTYLLVFISTELDEKSQALQAMLSTISKPVVSICSFL